MIFNIRIKKGLSIYIILFRPLKVYLSVLPGFTCKILLNFSFCMKIYLNHKLNDIAKKKTLPFSHFER